MRKLRRAKIVTWAGAATGQVERIAAVQFCLQNSADFEYVGALGSHQLVMLIGFNMFYPGLSDAEKTSFGRLQGRDHTKTTVVTALQWEHDLWCHGVRS